VGRFPNKYVIGLTGNIATGKSVVRQMLQHLGAYTIDADQLAHQVMMPGAPAFKPIVNTFGQFIVGQDGRIDRAILGKMVFGNAEALKKLEDITHPAIRQGIATLVTRAQQRVVVVEAIKLLEGDLASMVDSIWVVDAQPLTQYKRLIEKRKMSEADAKQRIQSQNSQAEKVKRANIVIKNDSNVDDTWKQVQSGWEKIRQELTGVTPAPTPAVPAPSVPATPPPAPTPAPQAPVKPPPSPSVSAPAPSAPVASGDIAVKRGTPSNAELIATFVSSATGSEVTRMDIMLAFGEKSFHIGEAKDGTIVGIVGWTVENLVTRIDEFYVSNGTQVESVANAMVLAVEEASGQLQSEVAFFFLETNTNVAILNAIKNAGYATITLQEIKIPVWRDAVGEATRGKQVTVLWKQLRTDRVLQPI
jgi:dephospho-CoA kinase